MKIKHRRRMPFLDSARNHLWHQVIAVIKLHNGQVTLVELSFVLFRDIDLLYFFLDFLRLYYFHLFSQLLFVGFCK